MRPSFFGSKKLKKTDFDDQSDVQVDENSVYDVNQNEVVEHVDEDVSKKAIMPMAVLVLFIFLIGYFHILIPFIYLSSNLLILVKQLLQVVYSTRQKSKSLSPPEDPVKCKK